MTTNKTNSNTKSFSKFLKSKSFFDTIFSILILAIMHIIISNPKRYTDGTISGIKLFFTAVLPGLFPFMLLTKLLTELGIMFKISRKFDNLSKFIFGTPGVSIYALFMSILSGYPIGAKIIGDLYDKKLIDENDAKKMSVFCTTSGPIFVIGSVGTIMFGNYLFGIILYVSHIASSVILGIVYGKLINKKTSIKPSQIRGFEPSKQENILSSCISNTINSLFVVGAYITIFYLISEIFDSFNLITIIAKFLSPLFKAVQINTENTKGLLYGILEVTRGCKVLSITPSLSNLMLASGIISLSGFSIIMQSMAFLKTAKIKAHFFILSKSVHMIVSMIFCGLLSILFL